MPQNFDTLLPEESEHIPDDEGQLLPFGVHFMIDSVIEQDVVHGHDGAQAVKGTYTGTLRENKNTDTMTDDLR
jgi:hypothetical protein